MVYCAKNIGGATINIKLTLEALAEQTGLSKSALSKYESDDVADISIYAVTTLAGFYGVATEITCWA